DVEAQEKGRPAGDSSSVGAEEPSASEPWSEQASSLPMSKLDDPETMCSDMDEDEFIQELDKFVDIIKSEDPDTAMANGMMLLDDSDGSGAVEDMIGSDIQGAYGYGQQGQFDQHGGQPHAALLHSMMNGDGGLGAHMVMDPSSMQVDYATGTIMTSEGALSIASTLTQQSMAAAYQQQHYVTSSETAAGMATSYADAAHADIEDGMSASTTAAADAAAAVVSPIPSGIKDVATAEAGQQQNGGVDMDSAAPPSSMSA
ncbi:hypothetical protein GGF43_001171, partial [Coemansia sp. RSA 2618]